MDEHEFVSVAAAELQALVSAIDERVDGVYAELSGDVLTLEFEDDTKYIVNSHSAARQIWLAAGRTAWHFNPDQGGGQLRWLDSKTGAELWDTVGRQLSAKLNSTLSNLR